MATSFLIGFFILIGVFLFHTYLNVKRNSGFSDYFLMNGELKLQPFIASLASTNLSLGNFVLVGAIWGYLFGLSAIFWFTVAAFLFVLSFYLYAPDFKNFIEDRSNSGSIHEFISSHYSEGNHDIYASRIRVLASFATIITLVFATVLELHLGAMIASSILGGSIFVWFSTLLLSIGLYAAYGGFRSVVFTDAIQGGFLFIAALFILVLVSTKWINLPFEPDSILSKYPTSLENIIGDLGWQNILSFSIITFGWFLVTMDTWQRNAATRSIDTSKKGILIGGGILLFFMICFSLLGMFDAVSIAPWAEGSSAVQGHSGGFHPISDLLLIGDSLSGLSSIILGIVGLAFVMAAISTADTFLVVCSYSLIGDYLIGFKKGKKIGELDDAENARFLTYGKVSALVFSVLVLISWLICNQLRLLLDPLTLFFIAYSVQFGLLVPILFMKRIRKAKSLVVYYSILVGMIVTLGLGIYSAIILFSSGKEIFGMAVDQFLPLSPILGIGFSIITFLILDLLNRR